MSVKLNEDLYYTRPQKDICFEFPKYICYDDEDNVQVFVEGTDDEYWMPTALLSEVDFCPKCNTQLQICETRKGKFWGCRNYSKGCRYYVPISQTTEGLTSGQKEFHSRVEGVEGIPCDAAEAAKMSRGWG
jgi:hypothetical protein